MRSTDFNLHPPWEKLAQIKNFFFFLTFPKVAKKRGMLLKIGAVWQLMIIGAGVVKPCRGGDKKFDVRKCR